MTTAQTLQAFAVLAVVLEATRRHFEFEALYGTETLSRGQMVVNFSPGSPGRLVWGQILDTAIAVQIFFSIIPSTIRVEIHLNDELKTFLGEFWLSASTSTVSSS